jgi:hypothetical protein
VGSGIKTGEARFYGAREGAALPLFEFDFKSFDFFDFNDFKDFFAPRPAIIYILHLPYQKPKPKAKSQSRNQGQGRGQRLNSKERVFAVS